MLKVLITLILVAGFSMSVYAEHPMAEHPAPAVEQTAADKALSALIAKGVSPAEAQAAVDDVLAQAKDQGLSDQEVADRLNEAVNKLGMAAPSMADAPKDHPAH